MLFKRLISSLFGTKKPAHIKVEVNHTIETFQQLNRQRLERALSMLKPRQAIFIELIPLLFNANHENWPGYVGPDTRLGSAALWQRSCC